MSYARRGIVSTRDILHVCATRIVPAGLIAGAGIETFMYFTGFWKTATRKEAERQAEFKANMGAFKEGTTGSGSSGSSSTGSARQ
jgi:hypothetical protein